MFSLDHLFNFLLFTVNSYSNEMKSLYISSCHVGAGFIHRTAERVFFTVFLFDSKESRELYLGRWNILASWAVLIRSIGEDTHILRVRTISDVTVAETEHHLSGIGGLKFRLFLYMFLMYSRTTLDEVEVELKSGNLLSR